MNENVAQEKSTAWKIVERILGKTGRAASHRPDWRLHRETDTSVLVTFSKTGHLFYDVNKKDLEVFSDHRRAFFVFLVGSHKDVFILPVRDIREHIKAEGLMASLEFGDYKLHLVRDYRGVYFREIPSLNLAPFHNQYAQLL